MLRAEFTKADWKQILLGVIFIPLVLVWMGGSNSDLVTGLNIGGKSDRWYALYMVSGNTYAALFLPVFSGIIAAILCRIEHIGGGWKQMMSLPISRSAVYISKYIVIIFSLALMQVFFLVAVIGFGMIKGIDAPIPWKFFLRSSGGAWFAVIALAALQLWFSSLWKSFGGSLSFNIAASIPALIVAQSKIGPWYPWSQPYYALLPWNSENWDMIFTTSGISLVIFLGLGWIHFLRREWT